MIDILGEEIKRWFWERFRSVLHSLSKISAALPKTYVSERSGGEGQPSAHIQFDAPIGVNVVVDQRRQRPPVVHRHAITPPRLGQYLLDGVVRPNPRKFQIAKNRWATPNQSPPQQPPNQSDCACLWRHSAPGNAGAATPPGKSS